MQQNTNNPLVEVGVILLAVCLIAAATVLLTVNKLNFSEAMPLYLLAVGLYGGKLAFQAPSPAQQAQLGALTAQVVNTLPSVVSAVSQAPPAQATPQVAPAQATYQPAPQVAAPVYQPPPLSAQQTAPVPVPQFSAPLQAVTAPAQSPS